jgi:uncharacterized protein (DUF1778 family)
LEIEAGLCLGSPDQFPSANCGASSYGSVADKLLHPVRSGSNVMATSTRRKVFPQREIKRERIELRVAASAKQLIHRAMAVSGLTAGDLAYEGARKVLEEHERMVLIGSDGEAFLKAISAPPPPNKKLVAALRRHRRLFG